MGHIFISYSHKDKDYVHRLQDALQTEGFEVWIDDRIHYGSEWPKVVTRNLDISDGVIVVLSNNSYESDMVQNEVTRAREKHKPIFPLLLDGENWLIVQAKQFVDVRDGSLPTQSFYERLVSITPRNKSIPLQKIPPQITKEDPELELKKLESQAIQLELSGKLWDALKIYYQIKRLDPLFPRVDIKISQLEKETHPEPPRHLPSVQPSVSIPRRSNIPIAGAIIGVLCIVSVFLLTAILGEKSLHTTLPKTPTPSPTTQVTATFELPTATLELPTETSTATLMPPTPTLGIVATMMSPKDGMTLLYVPAGEFLMGSPASDFAHGDEKPQHTVYLDAFWIDKTDVTNAMYTKCVGAGICKQPRYLYSYTHSSYYGNSQFGNYPVIYMDWYRADAYCKWAGRQLPTEAQWEKAARGTDGRIYPWGNDPPNNNLLNYSRNLEDTTQVGVYPKGASIYGALDMAGNVWQWVNDWYGYYQSSLESNPLGPDSGQYRVLRGGSWSSGEDEVRTADRNWRDPTTDVYSYFGFRCARSQ
jgi:formylglycine-generating enzyme required for sulfatase activity